MTVQEAVAEYLAHGWKLCRIRPKQKRPTDTEWNAPGHEIRVPEAFPLGWGVGLLHAFSGTCCIDIDNYTVARQWFHDRGVDLDALIEDPFAVQIITGRPNSTKLLYALPQPLPSIGLAAFDTTDKNGAPSKSKAVEFRCGTHTGNSAQDVLPPSMWLSKDETVSQPREWLGDWRNLPPLPAELQALWEAELGGRQSAEPAPAALQGPPAEAADPKLAAWLADQDPDAPYEDWLKVGMKLHAAFRGSSDGFKLWDQWSARSVGKYPGGAELYLKWRTFRLEGPAIATLDKELASMPADPAEFNAVQEELSEGDVPAPKQTAVPEAAAPAALEAEGLNYRHNRELMQEHIVVLTGEPETPFYVLPEHTVPKVRAAAGIAGIAMGARQLDRLLGPHMVPIPVGKTTKLVRASDFLENAAWRREAHSYGFRPHPSVIYSGHGRTYVNIYRHDGIAPKRPTDEQIEPLLWLLRRVNKEPNGEPVVMRWLCSLYAYCLANPGRKVPWAPLLMSRPTGTGKTTLLHTIPELLFGKAYVRTMTNKDIIGGFPGDVLNCAWWVTIQELSMGAGKQDAKDTFNIMKPWITDHQISIRRMYHGPETIQNFIQFTASSNYPDALHLEDGDDERRWLVGEVTKKLTLQEMQGLNPLFGEDDVRHPDAAAWVRWWFYEYAEKHLQGFSPALAPPMTFAKEEMRSAGRKGWEGELYDRREQRLPPFDKDLITTHDVKDALVGHKISTGQATELMRKYCGQPWHAGQRTEKFRVIYVWQNNTAWERMTPNDVHEYIRTGIYPKGFTGENCSPDDPLLG